MLESTTLQVSVQLLISSATSRIDLRCGGPLVNGHDLPPCESPEDGSHMGVRPGRLRLSHQAPRARHRSSITQTPITDALLDRSSALRRHATATRVRLVNRIEAVRREALDNEQAVIACRLRLDSETKTWLVNYMSTEPAKPRR